MTGQTRLHSGDPFPAPTVARPGGRSRGSAWTTCGAAATRGETVTTMLQVMIER